MEEHLKLTPIRYRLDGLAEIRLIDNIPEPYWYIAVEMLLSSPNYLGISSLEYNNLYRNCFSVAYWTGSSWSDKCPRRYDTPEEAFEQYYSTKTMWKSMVEDESKITSARNS